MISVIGGVGLFLLGMAVMTDGLKALAGSALRGVLAKAAATPLHGTFWGAVITLLVQSSSATTMTTIGLVSASWLTTQQQRTGLGAESPCFFGKCRESLRKCSEAQIVTRRKAAISQGLAWASPYSRSRETIIA
jgi:hypothetical protein